MTRQARYKLRKPWVRHLEWARRRCKDPKAKAWPSHGAKGIKCRLTLQEVETLWIRDAAARMTKPSLDRIDSSKDYEFWNCRFVEHFNNSRAPHDPDVQKYLDESQVEFT
jgi:hypothetical protein